MRKWLIAFLICIVFWVACDAALQYWGFFLFENFMRLPLLTAASYSAPLDWWFAIAHFSFWSIGTLILAAYAALGFFPLILVPVVKRRWPLWLTGAFVLAHPGLWFIAIVHWASGAHP